LELQATHKETLFPSNHLDRNDLKGNMARWDGGRIIHSSKVGILESQKSLAEWYHSRTDREWVDDENENILEPTIWQLGQSTACRQYE
jgi:hypothetical protein